MNRKNGNFNMLTFVLSSSCANLNDNLSVCVVHFVGTQMTQTSADERRFISFRHAERK